MRRFCNEIKEERRIDKLDHHSVQDSDMPALHKKLIHTTDKGLKIFLVDGNAVRNQFNPDFVKGGHGLAYKFIPKDEVWIENVGGPQEMKDILAHELYEHQEMEKGHLDYKEAHGDATQVEDALREFDKMSPQGVLQAASKLAAATDRLRVLLANPIGPTRFDKPVSPSGTHDTRWQRLPRSVRTNPQPLDTSRYTNYESAFDATPHLERWEFVDEMLKAGFTAEQAATALKKPLHYIESLITSAKEKEEFSRLRQLSKDSPEWEKFVEETQEKAWKGAEEEDKEYSKQFRASYKKAVKIVVPKVLKGVPLDEIVERVKQELSEYKNYLPLAYTAAIFAEMVISGLPPTLTEKVRKGCPEGRYRSMTKQGLIYRNRFIALVEASGGSIEDARQKFAEELEEQWKLPKEEALAITNKVSNVFEYPEAMEYGSIAKINAAQTEEGIEKLLAISRPTRYWTFYINAPTYLANQSYEEKKKRRLLWTAGLSIKKTLMVISKLTAATDRLRTLLAKRLQ